MKNEKMENLERYFFKGEGEYDIPPVLPCKKYEPVKWLSFNYMLSTKTNQENLGVHFFVHDYQFTRIWNDPDHYIEPLKKFRYVCGPDFSIYNNMPKAMQVWNHYRKHWIEAYYRLNGVNIIPTVTWALPQTFKFCFDGEPEDSYVAISTIGVKINVENMDIFMMGVEEIEKRLSPKGILCNGIIPDVLKERVIPMERAYSLFASKQKKKTRGNVKDEYC